MFKKIKEAMQKQERTPLFVAVVVTVVTLIAFAGNSIAILAGDVTEFSPLLGLVVTILLAVSSLALLLVFVLGFKRSVAHDRAQLKIAKDEREILHDQLVATIGYKIAVYALSGYVIWTGDIPALVLLVAIVIATVYMRIKLD